VKIQQEQAFQRGVCPTVRTLKKGLQTFVSGFRRSAEAKATVPQVGLSPPEER
jgi:hypothetical protein